MQRKRRMLPLKMFHTETATPAQTLFKEEMVKKVRGELLEEIKEYANRQTHEFNIEPIMISKKTDLKTLIFSVPWSINVEYSLKMLAEYAAERGDVESLALVLTSGKLHAVKMYELLSAAIKAGRFGIVALLMSVPWPRGQENKLGVIYDMFVAELQAASPSTDSNYYNRLVCLAMLLREESLETNIVSTARSTALDAEASDMTHSRDNLVKTIIDGEQAVGQMIRLLLPAAYNPDWSTTPLIERDMDIAQSEMPHKKRKVHEHKHHAHAPVTATSTTIATTTAAPVITATPMVITDKKD